MSTSRDLTTLDFDSIKENLKQYLQSQDVFKDYDFEGSNINTLLDVLAYNTHLNGFYLNMIASEMFLDSAIQRDSIVSHAKELNYLPRSFRSATANVNITIHDNTVASGFIPRGTSFSGSDGNKNFTFTTAENINVPGSGGVFVANNVMLYEGSYTHDSYVVNASNPSRFILSNKTVDTNSISITVIEDNGATNLEYRRADNLFGIDESSQIFFLQPAENESYEVIFGDGVIGRRPKDRSLVVIQYRICNGELPNGIHTFSPDDDIGNSTFINVDTNEAARGGAIPESISSIKLNAPRAFTTQERVVTAKDYEILLKTNFSEINEVSAYGGEFAIPPRYGKAIIAIDLKSTDELPRSNRQEYYNFLKPRSPLSIDPVFVAPEYTYISVDSRVKYDVTQTSLSANDIRSIVSSTIQNYNTTFLNGFNRTLYYSNLVSVIDESQSSIISNDTIVRVIKSFKPTIALAKNYTIDFGLKFTSDRKQVFESSQFVYEGNTCRLIDDGEGDILIVTPYGDTVTVLQRIGTINYNTGLVELRNFEVERANNDMIHLYGYTEDRDITAQRQTVLAIRDEDINVKIIGSQ